MAPPPVERSGGESTAADTTRSLPTPFLTKTYQLVDDSAIDDVISWNEDGSTFVVWNPTEFAKDFLPKYFKHNNFSSFVRQLNTYGFRKVVPDRWEFSNECFRKGEKRLLCDIQRRKIANLAGAATTAATPQPVPAVTVAAAPPVLPVPTISPTDSGEEQVISSNSFQANAPLVCRDLISGTNSELVGENERLRQENQQLNKELSHMKSLCSNIYVMMSNFSSNEPEKPESSSQATTAVKPLDLLPSKRYCDDLTVGNNRSEPEEEQNARLFGVLIGNKRGRESAEKEVKLEPLDQENNSSSGVDNQEKQWISPCHQRSKCTD